MLTSQVGNRRTLMGNRPNNQLLMAKKTIISYLLSKRQFKKKTKKCRPKKTTQSP